MPRPRLAEIRSNHPAPPPRSTIRIDIGWPYLISAMTLLAATVLVPAFEDLSYARWQRDRALMLEEHRFERMLAHERYAAALDNHDADLVRALAATQLNEIPADRTVLLAATLTGEASVFPSLEPEPLVLPERHETHSVLKKLTTSNETRPWLIGVGALMLFFGLTPPARFQGG
jgi:hypothetical protein